jgi:hypothetical protein
LKGLCEQRKFNSFTYLQEWRLSKAQKTYKALKCATMAPTVGTKLEYGPWVDNKIKNRQVPSFYLGILKEKGI